MFSFFVEVLPIELTVDTRDDDREEKKKPPRVDRYLARSEEEQQRRARLTLLSFSLFFSYQYAHFFSLEQ